MPIRTSVRPPPAGSSRSCTPMSPGRTPDRVPRSVRPRPGRVCGRSGSTAGATRSRRGATRVTAKLDAGQGETELDNDLLIGARLLERAATGVPREHRATRCCDAAAALREPGDPFTRAGAGAVPRGHRRCWTQYPLRELVTRGEHLRRLGGPAAGPLQRLVRVVPALHRRLGRRGQPACTARSRPPPRRCRGSPRWASTSCTCRRSTRSARCTARDATTRVTAEPDDVGSPWAIGSDEGGHDAVHPDLGTIEDFDEFVAAARDERSGGGAGPGAAVRAGPPVGQGPSGVVHRAARRHDRLRGEPAEEVPGHLSAELRQRPGRALRRGAAGGAVLDRPRRQDLPGRQPAHQAAELLGLADRRGQERPTPTCCSWPRRSPGRPGCTVWPNSASRSRIRTSPGAPPSGSSTEFGEQIAEHADYARPEPVRQHPRHPAREPAARRPGHVRHPRGAGRRR